MDWGLIVGISSILIAVLIALITQWVKTRKYPGKLAVSLVKHRRVMGEKPYHYPDISLNYGAYQIDKKLQYVQILLYNKRAYDIKEEGAKAHLYVTLPKGMEWADVRVVKETDKVGASADVEDGNMATANIGFDMLRKGDSFLVEGLIETDRDYSDKLFKKMSFSHRIPEVDSVVKVDYLHSFPDNRALWRLILVLIAYCLAILPAHFFTTYNLPLRFIDAESGNSSYLFINDKGEIIAAPTVLEKESGYKVDASVFKDRMIPDTTYYGKDKVVRLTHSVAVLLIFVILLYLLNMVWKYLHWRKVLMTYAELVDYDYPRKG